MIDPWRHIDGDDAIVVDLLAATVEIVLELEGWLHPELRIVARDGHLRIDCGADEDEPVIFLPIEAYVRVGRVGWSDSRDRLEVTEVPDEFGVVERELLMLQTALHSQCEKVPWLVATHPVLADDLDASVVAAVRALRPDFRTQPTTPAGVLWSTRCLRLPPAGSSLPEPVALPIVDLLNHDCRGATGVSGPDGFAVRAGHATGTVECFLDYGLQRTALDLAVDYGFVDRTAIGRGASPPDPDALRRIIVAAEQHPSPAATILAEAAALDAAAATW